MSRIKLTLAYKGTRFAGWQIQAKQRTVQGCLENALARICNQKVRVHASGRTDAGVHALGQVVHFDPPRERISLPWQRALNALLPEDMAVLDFNVVDKDFHARFTALSKEYSYTLWTHEDYVLPQKKAYVWPVGSLDLDKMQEAARIFIGEQDFAALQNQGSKVKSTVRRVFWILPEKGFWPQELIWRFCANGYLKQMVRNIISCLVEVGKGKWTVRQVEELIRSKDRRLGPATAPGKGLCLEKVHYSENPE